MQTASFREWNLTSLDDTFGLSQILHTECKVLNEWQSLSGNMELTDFEKQTLLNLQEPLIWGGKNWNEFELENKFIGPIMMAARIDNREIGYFVERVLSSSVGDFKLSGIVDGMIATGFRDPKIPYFCMHEYKRSVDNQVNPDAQALASMLVARAKNNNEKPVYGLYIVGLIWNFMVLNTNDTYCISQNYDASNESIFAIFKMLKALKQIILEAIH